MKSGTSALKFYRIDTSQPHPELMTRIREILKEGQSHNAEIFSEDSWNWQYKELPSHEARVYVCEAEGKIMGYYHVPVYEGIAEGEKKKFAMVQDVAVSDVLRGRGVFRQLAEFATQDLIESDIFLAYTFPNAKSIRTFLKYNNYQLVKTFDTYILPVDSAAVIAAKTKIPLLNYLAGIPLDILTSVKLSGENSELKARVYDYFTDETIALFQKHNSTFQFHLNRSAEYLKWRFQKKPTAKHYVLTAEKNNSVLAAAVVKADKMFGVDTAIILDFAFSDKSGLKNIVTYLRKNSETIFDRKVSLIFTACCSDVNFSSLGFFKIPQRLNPRHLNMLSNALEKANDNCNSSSSWHATLADWDVF